MKVLASISIRNGAVAGVLAFILLVSLYYMGRHPLMIAPYFDFRNRHLWCFYFLHPEENSVTTIKIKCLYYWQGVIGGMIVVIVANTVFDDRDADFWLVATHEFVESYIVQLTAYLKEFSGRAN